jgi:hypothetical protein
MRGAAVRIFLASFVNGLNEERRRICLEKGKPKYLLESFFYQKHCEDAIKLVEKDNFLLDSGAFSFMSGKEISKEKMEQFVLRYIEFINLYDIQHFIEVDVDSIYGLDQVERWRELIEKETGKKTIPVWHRWRGIEYWKDMVRNYRYVAMGSQVQKVFNISQQDYDNIKKLVFYAYTKGVKVHGLGFTKTKELPDYKYFSVDSSSWNTTAFLGNNIQIFNGQHMIQRKIKTTNKVDHKKLGQHNFIEWCKYQKYMDRGIV